MLTSRSSCERPVARGSMADVADVRFGWAAGLEPTLFSLKPKIFEKVLNAIIR